MAMTAVADPEIKATLLQQLDDAIDFPERIVFFAMARGWYNPWEVKEQFALDNQNIQSAVKLANLGEDEHIPLVVLRRQGAF